MIRTFIVEIDDSLRGAENDIFRLERAYGAEEVKTGEWQQDMDGTYLCSECGSGFEEQPTLMGKPMFAYCPICGAKMEGEE